jgi:uncharacterized SAM-binding protein YcdF (DUF218 family)
MIKLLAAIAISTLLATSCISVSKGPHKAYNEVVKHDVTFDAIIVPGIPFENGRWDTVMKARVLWAYILYKNGITRNIIFSGNAVYSPYNEAKIMGLYAQELGVPAKHIFYETRARHSTENVFYSYLVAKENNFKVVALATDPFQSALLRSFTRARFGTPIYHLPFVMDSLRKYDHIEPVINPESAKTVDFTSITSEESRIKRLFGTLGRDIEWKEFDGRALPPL